MSKADPRPDCRMTEEDERDLRVLEPLLQARVAAARAASCGMAPPLGREDLPTTEAELRERLRHEDH